MSLNVSINSSTVSIKVGTFQVVNSNDMTKACSFIVEDVSGTTRYTHRMPVVCSDSVNGVLFAGYIDEPSEQNLYPNAQNEVLVSCLDYRSLALKRRPTKDYTNMQAGDVAIDMVSNYLAAEGVTAGYAYRHITTDTDWNTGTLSGTIGALNVGDGNLELSRAGSTVTKTFSINTDWNTGTLTSIDAQNNMLNLHASNALKYTGSCIGNLGNCYAYWEFWAGSYTIASGDMLQYDVWISSTSPEIKAAVDLTMSDGNTMRDFSGQACHDNYNIHAHPGSDLKGFADDQWYSRTVQLTALSGKTASFATIAFEGDNGGDYTAYFKNIKIVNSSFVTQVTLYDGAAHPYQPYLIAIGQNYVVGNNGYVNLAVTNATVYEKSGTWMSPAISIDAAKIVCTSLINWTTSIPTGATAGTQTSGSNAPATPAGTTITIYSSIDDTGTWQPVSFKGGIPNLMAGFNIAGRNLYLKAVLSIATPSPEVSPILKSLTSTITSSWTQTKSDSLTICRQQSDFATGTSTGAGWQGYLSGSAYGLDNGVALAGLLESFDYAASVPANFTQFSTGSPAAGILNRKQLDVTLSTGTDWRGRFDGIGATGSANYQNFSAQVSFSFPDVTIENGAGLAFRTTAWGNNNDSYAYAASMIVNKGHGSTPNTGNTVLELSKGTNSTGAGSYTNLGSFPLPFTPSNGTTYTLKILVNNNIFKLSLDDVLYLTVADSTYSAAGQIAVRYYNNTGATQTAIFDNFGVVALQPSGGLFTGTWDNGSGISLGTGIGVVGNSLFAWDADVPSGCTLTAQTSINGGSTWQTATNGAAIPNLPTGTNTNGLSVQVKFTLTSTYPSITPILKGWTIWLTTQTSANGTRISPALAIANVGRIGSTSVTLNSLIPTNTSVLLHASFNAAGPWTSINLSVPNGNDSEIIPSSLISPQPDPVLDFFTTTTSGNYTSSAGGSDGSTATWTFNVGDPRNYLSGLQGSGKQGILLYNTFVSGHADIFVEADINRSDAGGIILRSVDTNNFYFLSVADASAISNANTLKINKLVSSGAGATTALTVYSTNANDTLVTTARQLVTVLGATSTNSFTSLCGTATGYSECYSQGTAGAWAAAGALGSPSGNGFILDATTLEGQQIVAGTWTPIIRAKTSVGTVTADLYVRAYVRSGGGTYTQIGSNMVKSGVTLTTTATNFTFTGTSQPLQAFNTGDKLYFDVWLNITANSTGSSSATIGIVEAIGGTQQGNTGSCQIATPGYQTQPGSTITTLATGAISFTRGDYHRFRFQSVGTTLTGSMDNQQIVTATDATYPNAGKCGFICGVATSQQIQLYSFRVQNLGDSHDGQSIYTRLTLTSTDPTNTPQIQDMTTAIRSTAIGTGALIPQTDYAYKNTCGASFDDLASQSTTATNTQWQWDIDASKAFSFHHAYANPAPFYVWSGTHGNISWGLGQPGMQRPDMLYRNRQIVKGGVDTSTTDTRSFAGDGQAQTWTLPYPVDSIVSITLDKNSTLVGVRGTDTGKDFYYLQGDQVISQDANGTILADTDTLTITYVPQIPVLITMDNTGVENPSANPITVSLPGTTTQAQVAAITGDTGIIEDYIEVSGLSKAAAIQAARGLLQQYGVLGRNITFTVKKFGLAPGQLVNVTMPQHGIYNGVFLISKVTIKAMQAAGSDPDIVGGILYSYVCEATEGSTSAADWRAFWTKAVA